MGGVEIAAVMPFVATLDASYRATKSNAVPRGAAFLINEVV